MTTLRAALLLVTLTSATAFAGPKAKSTLALTPASLAGNGAELVKKVKRADTSAKPAVFHECEGQWTVHYAVALAVSVPSAELTLKITDVSRSTGPELVATRRKFVYSDAAVARGTFKLDHDDVSSPNAKLLLEIESDGVAITKQTFYIQGPARTTTAGAIAFTAAEAASDDEIEAGDVANKRR
jgi:hypothetical protein